MSHDTHVSSRVASTKEISSGHSGTKMSEAVLSARPSAKAPSIPPRQDPASICTDWDDFVFDEYSLTDWGSEAIYINIVTICYKNGKGFYGDPPPPKHLVEMLLQPILVETFLQLNLQNIYKDLEEVCNRSIILWLVFCLLISFNSHFNIS